MDLVQRIIDKYNYFTYDLAYPETRDWFLVSRPHKIVILMFAYLYFCVSLGPRYMQNRKPYNLKIIILLYNIFQVILSIYIFLRACYGVLFLEYNLCCQGLYLDSASRHWLAVGIYIYFIAKISELLDTIFFVLRKSNRQITSLHLHHHTIMVVMSWVALTYYPGGQMVLIGVLNPFVHAFMYTYYLIANLGDEYKKYLWWKKYVTMLQLLQFVILTTHGINSLFYKCDYPDFFKWTGLAYGFFFLYMFGKFYYYNYMKTTIQTFNGVERKVTGEKYETRKNL